MSKLKEKMQKLRIEGISVVQTAKGVNDVWYYWDFCNNKVEINRHSSNYEVFTMDKKFNTEKECKDWYDKFGKAFEYFNC